MALLRPWLNLVLAIWLLIAPFALGYPLGAPRANDFWSAVALVMAGLVAVLIRRFRWVHAAVGLWLVISPLALGHSDPAPIVNDVLVGLAVIAVALAPMPTRRRAGPQPA